MKGDEFKIILEDINEKFDVIIEGHKLLNEKLDRQIRENRAEHEEVRDEVLSLRKDLNEHRENTELHGGKKKQKVSSFANLQISKKDLFSSWPNLSPLCELLIPYR